MKFISIAVAMLMANTQASQLFDEDFEDELTEDLNIRMSRYYERAGWKKGETLGNALRPISDMRRGMDPNQQREAMEDLSKWTKKNFGWTAMEKYNEIKPEQRYWPLIKDIMGSPEVQAQKEFYKRAATDPLL